MFLTNSSIQWFYISWYLAKLWFSCQVMPWDGPNAKDKCSLAFEIIDLTTLNLGLFSVIRLSSKCDAAYCGLKIFLSGYETAISPQKYISKSHWPHKSILHMMSQCSIIIWVITLVKKMLALFKEFWYNSYALKNLLWFNHGGRSYWTWNKVFIQIIKK